MIRTRLAVCALALVAACDGAADKAETPVAPAVTPPAATASQADPTSPADALAAFQAAWGSAGPVAYKTPDAGAQDEPMTYSKGTLVSLGGDRYALVSEGQGGEGHVSAGALAIHYLTRTATGFTRVGAWPDVVDGGTFGNPPEWTVRTDLTPAPAIVTKAGGTWQGYTCSWSDLIELTPDQPILRTDSIPVGYDDSGAKEEGAEAMDGELTPDMKGRSFSVRYTGDRTETVRYALQGQSYKATTSPDLLTC